MLLTFLQLVGVSSYRSLFKQWRLAICGIVALAAIITPSGDPITLLRPRDADGAPVLRVGLDRTHRAASPEKPTQAAA